MEEKRGRGRPRKHPIVEILEIVDNVEKRGRGRPRKIVPQPIQEVIEAVDKPKRGRPKKLPEPIQELVDTVLEKARSVNKFLSEPVQKIIEELILKEEQEIKDIIQEERIKRKGEWDIKKDEPILFFDKDLSYEITGYKPINKKKSLDFKPEWFTETREVFKRTGHYCQFPPGSKSFDDFWTEQYIRCRDGMTVNGYTITGDNYFFLNFYQLANLETAKAGQGRNLDFPSFYVSQYEWFHYLELCKRCRKNAVLMKARGIG